MQNLNDERSYHVLYLFLDSRVYTINRTRRYKKKNGIFDEHRHSAFNKSQRTCFRCSSGVRRAQFSMQSTMCAKCIVHMDQAYGRIKHVDVPMLLLLHRAARRTCCAATPYSIIINFFPFAKITYEINCTRHGIFGARNYGEYSQRVAFRFRCEAKLENLNPLCSNSSWCLRCH